MIWGAIDNIYVSNIMEVVPRTLQNRVQYVATERRWTGHAETTSPTYLFHVLAIPTYLQKSELTFRLDPVSPPDKQLHISFDR